MAAIAVALAVNLHVFRGAPRPLASLLGDLAGFGAWQFLVCLVLARSVSAAHRWIRQQGWPLLAGLPAVAVAAAVAGTAAASLWPVVGQGADLATVVGQHAQWGRTGITMLLLAALLTALREFGWRRQLAAQAEHSAQLNRLALQGELAQARLRLLQSQVEPHFLFNSLANVRRLLRTDATAARSLLADLMRYLEEALPRMREGEPTLRREVELVRAYLAVHQVRMPGRLQVELDVPPELGALEVPSLSLLTLVENAIKHGLSPLVEGGTIRVAAQAAEGQLTLTVTDTGRGMGSGSGAGIGLSNLRARLRAMYGDSAHLSLQLNEPRGMIATIVLPQPLP